MLDQFVTGNVIDWKQSRLSNQRTIETQGNLEDLEITSNSLFYRCYKSMQSEIPFMAVVDLQALAANPNFITHEMNFWREYHLSNQHEAKQVIKSEEEMDEKLNGSNGSTGSNGKRRVNGPNSGI